MFNDVLNKKCIIRATNAGVFYGTVDKVTDDGFTVKVTNVRKIWYWDGAAAVEGLAADGTVCPDECKFTVTVASMIVTEVTQIIPCTDKAIQSIEAVKEWKA